MEIYIIAALGILMGFVTSICGGAGVFAVPTMLALGFHPINTLALNRISDLGCITGAISNYTRKVKEFNLKTALLVSIPLTIGAFFGANFSITIPETHLKLFIIFAVFVGIFFLTRKIKIRPETSKVNKPLGAIALLAVGFWSGAVGMAGATFAVLVLVCIFNQSFLLARSTDIVAAIPETALSIIIFTRHTELDLKLIAVMFVTSTLGAFLGSKLAIKKGSEFIRYSMVAISILMIIKVIYDLATI